MDGRRVTQTDVVKKKSSATDTPKTSEEEEDTCFIVFHTFSQLVMHTTEADTFQVVLFLISKNGGRE